MYGVEEEEMGDFGLSLDSVFDLIARNQTSPFARRMIDHDIEGSSLVS